MNHCFNCNSSYETPGTCNCYAPGGVRAGGGWVSPVLPKPSPDSSAIHVHVTPDMRPDDIARQVIAAMRRASYRVLADRSVA